MRAPGSIEIQALRSEADKEWNRKIVRMGPTAAPAWRCTSMPRDVGGGPRTAPGLHVAVHVKSPGSFHVWALVKFDRTDDDSFFLAVDGTPLPLKERFSGGDMFSFATAQAWVWMEVSDLTMAPGVHVLSALARKAGLRVDRLYLTKGEELPPADIAEALPRP